MNLVEVVAGSAAFESVLRLWRTDSATLGFMPEGGFEDCARDGCLIAAEAAGEVVGYVMFRRTLARVAAIVHLCVSSNRRGGGVARRLVEAVRDRCADCYEIRLRCRRDYTANAMWPRLGFVAVQDVPGRGRDGILTVWRCELAPLPLFRGLQSGGPALAVRAAIDANVFFDLDEESPGEEESWGLLADWLGEFVELSVTQELFNEIHRRASSSDRERQRSRAYRFAHLTRDVGREEAVLPSVKSVLGTGDAPSAESDARQIAMTIAGDTSFFITRDAEVLRAADAFDETFGLQVMSPHEVVRRFDELRREDEYRPRRLFFGPRTSASTPRASEIDEMADLLHIGQQLVEPRRRTIGRLREMLSAPDRYEAVTVRSGDHLVASYILDRGAPRMLAVPFFGVTASSLGRTAARHYGDALVAIAAREGRPLVRVEAAGGRVADALSDLGFSEEAGAWVKLTLSVTLPAESAAVEVERVGATTPPAAQLATRMAADLRALASRPGIARAAADVERALWPAKLLATGLPCFIVPIQPRWAKDLFDRELAFGTLFGANPTLVLNAENVYYRAARPSIVTAPGRVLWYVSADPAYSQSKAIRACSYVDEVVVGVAKDLFRRFKRLGVYEWSHVFELAKLDLTRELMAFRFAKTELFTNPVPWDTMQAILGEHTGRGSQLQSPLSISEQCFFDFYLRGVRASAA